MNHGLWNIISNEIYILIYTPVYTPYAGAVGMLLHVKVKFSMGKLKISVVVHFRSYRTSLSISTSRSRYEADLVVFFVQAQ